MAVQSGSAFLLPSSVAPALRGPAIEPAAGTLAPTATGAGSIEQTSVNLAGLLAIGGAMLAVARSSRRRSSEVTRRLRDGKLGRGNLVARHAESIAATAIANGNFTILVSALKKAGLVETVSGKTPYTVFAPTDDAFKSLLKELGVTADELLANPDLKNILLYHVVGGKAMSSSLQNGQQVKTAEGGNLAVKIGSGKVQVGRATVAAADIECTNGVIHVIDKVLLPPFDPAKEIGAMAPLGFFDPAGFSKAGDKAGFNNLRAAEIKHGRVAMMAALGAVAQHYVKFPGFEAVPAGLGAVTTAPGTYGFAALFLLSGVMELAVWAQDDKKEPGNFGDPVGLGMYNPDMRAKEINNGRMAMFSAIGIIAAEALTGKDGIVQLGF